MKMKNLNDDTTTVKDSLSWLHCSEDTAKITWTSFFRLSLNGDQQVAWNPCLPLDSLRNLACHANSKHRAPGPKQHPAKVHITSLGELELLLLPRKDQAEQPGPQTIPEQIRQRKNIHHLLWRLCSDAPTIQTPGTKLWSPSHTGTQHRQGAKAYMTPRGELALPCLPHKTKSLDPRNISRTKQRTKGHIIPYGEPEMPPLPRTFQTQPPTRANPRPDRARTDITPRPKPENAPEEPENRIC